MNTSLISVMVWFDVNIFKCAFTLGWFLSSVCEWNLELGLDFMLLLLNISELVWKISGL